MNSVQTYCFGCQNLKFVSSKEQKKIFAEEFFKSFVNRGRDGQNNKTDTFVKTLSFE
jgi:hypothetical protein